jgi:hypothetical protein
VSSEALPPDQSPSATPGDAEAALAARLDHLEHVLREELQQQKRRADRAEAQLRALGQLDEHAEDLVATARAEAAKVMAAARHELEQATTARQEADAVLQDARRRAREIVHAPRAGRPAPQPAAGGLDDELLLALRDHLIDVGALQTAMMSETRNAVIRLIQASSQARGTVLRPVPSESPSNEPEGGARPARGQKTARARAATIRSTPRATST